MDRRVLTADVAAFEARRSRQTFLATISHDLRTPLNAIVGFSQVLLQDDRLSPDQLRAISVIAHHADEIISVTNMAIYRARDESPLVEVAMRPFDLRSLFADVSRGVEFTARAHNCAVRVVVGSSVPDLVRGDEFKIRALAVCALEGAMHALPGSAVTTRVEWARGEARFEIVADPEDDPFAEPADAIGDRVQALNLSVARAYARLMKGECGARVEDGRVIINSTFTLAQVTDDAPAPDGSSVPSTDAAERMSRLDTALVARLRAAVESGDVEGAHAVTTIVAERDPTLADVLQRLLVGYRIEELLDLVELGSKLRELPSRTPSGDETST